MVTPKKYNNSGECGHCNNKGRVEDTFRKINTDYTDPMQQKVAICKKCSNFVCGLCFSKICKREKIGNFKELICEQEYNNHSFYLKLCNQLNDNELKNIEFFKYECSKGHTFEGNHYIKTVND